VSTFCTPTEVITARTAPPAITPVPSGAGFNSTCPRHNGPRQDAEWWFGQMDPDQILLGRLNPLANRLGNFFRFAGTVADHPGSGVAHHHQRSERHVLCRP